MRPEWIDKSTDPILIALRNDDAAAFLTVLNGRESTGRKLFAGQSLLHVAAQAGAFQCAQILLKAGVEIELYDDVGHTPLIDAVSYGHEELAKLLIERGAVLEYLYTPPNTTDIAARLKARASKQFEKMRPEMEMHYRKLFDDVSSEIDQQIGDVAKSEVISRLLKNSEMI